MNKDEALNLIRFVCQDYFKMHNYSVNAIYNKFLETDSMNDLKRMIKDIQIEQMWPDLPKYKPHLNKIFNPKYSQDIIYAFDESGLALRLSRYQEDRRSHTMYFQKVKLNHVYFDNEKGQDCILNFTDEQTLFSFLSELKISPNIHHIANKYPPDDEFVKMNYQDIANKIRKFRK